MPTRKQDPDGNRDRRRRIDSELRENVKELACVTTRKYIERAKSNELQKGDLADVVKLLDFIKEAGLAFTAKSKREKAKPGEDPFEGIGLDTIMGEMDNVQSGTDG